MKKYEFYFIAAAALVGLVAVLEYPLFGLIAAASYAAWYIVRDRRWWLVPAASLGLGAAGYQLGVFWGRLQALAGSGQAPASAGVGAWFTLHPLACPADALARGGLVLGAVGTLAALAWLKDARGKGHDERHVHGLRVADNPALGTRRWAGDKDLAHVAEFGPPREGKFGGGTVVGKLKGRIVRLYPDKCKPPLPQHACVVAGTGAGKTYSFVIPNAIAAAMEGESLVLTDPKGELACTLGPWLREKGYKVYLFNLAYPQWSSCWNPVLEARDDEEITAFATAVISNAATERSGYFLMKEIQLLKALVYLLRHDFPPEQAHLRSALSLLSWPVEALDARFEEAYRSGRLPREGYEEWKGAVSSNYDNAVSGLSAKLNVVRAESVAKLLSRQEIDLSALGKEKAALFCVLPIGSGHLKPILATFYYFFFRRLYGLAAEHGGKLPNPTRFLLDEFANVGQIPGFAEVISTARSLGIRIQFVLQGLKQLQDVYGGAEAEAILSNCPIQLFLGGDDATTTRYFSQRLGEAAVYAETARREVTLPWQRITEIERRTEGPKRRPLMEPEELAGMDPLAAVCLVRWALPIYLEKVGWGELPQAAEIQALAAKTLAEVMPARPDVKVELPDVPEGPPPDTKRRDRAQERGGGRAGGAPAGAESDGPGEIDPEVESLGI